MYMGPNFWTQPDPTNIQQTQPNPTHEYLGRTRPDPTRRQFCSSALIISNVDYCSVCTLKSRRMCNSEHSVNTKLSSVTRWSLSHLISIGLARLLPLCRLLWSYIGDNNIMDIFKLQDPTQPNPWMDPTHVHLWEGHGRISTVGECPPS